MRDIDDCKRRTRTSRTFAQKIAQAFEVLVARQYFAPWNQLAERDCRDC